ncbi:MAG: UDP-N-acetylmuramoyl-L-alanyl-D-glutamate--2,6-diaminopimelate ligase [Desulfomicrobium escambiense]|nr:UDP-N-acetylmuramoyl-L-alanyl-D-glutamate--2,6-diaminopimelate ligase [Desulfomicrobium escambiense]
MPSPSVVIRPVVQETPEATRLKVRTLQKQLGLTEKDVARVLGRLAAGSAYTYVKNKITEEAAAGVMALKLAGVELEAGTRRYYPMDSLAAHVLGGINLSGESSRGIEYLFYKPLAGKQGRRLSYRVNGGRDYQTQILQPPVPGRDIVLTLDATIQYIAEKELARAVAEHKAAWGSVVIMDPASGEVLAMASWPTYDLNDYPGPEDTWLNRPVGVSYEPGSTFKIITAAAARERNRVGFSEVFDCSAGFIRVGGTTITDHDREHVLSFPQVLIKSSNVGTVLFAQRLTIPEYHETIKAFGIGTKTGIELPGESLRPPLSARPVESQELAPPRGHRLRGHGLAAPDAPGDERLRHGRAAGPAPDREGRRSGRGGRGRRGPRSRDQRQDRRRPRRPRLRGRRRGGHGQGRPARRLPHRREDRDGEEVRPGRPRLHEELHRLLRRLHAGREAAAQHDRRPRLSQGILLRRAGLRARVPGHRPPGPPLSPRPAGAAPALRRPDRGDGERQDALKLADVFRGIPVLAGGAPGDLEIAGIAYNSKAVRPGFLFAALRGAAQNGMDFVVEAEANGAAAVLSAWPKPPAGRAAWIQVADAREALALAAANFHGHPSDRMKVVGVTGTKGKTTTTYLLEEILRAAGTAPGVIGTIEYRRPGWKVPAPRTTPEAPDLQALLGEMLGAGVSHCVMEVSSHALEQKRVWGVGFDVAVFTNLSGEHLDYHPSMEGYFEAKKKLFALNHKKRAAVVNMDDPWGQRLVAELPMTTVTFGLEPAAIVRALKYVLSEAGLDAQVAYPGGVMRLQSSLVGRHNLYNVLAAAAAALALNVAPADIVKGVAALSGVPGRFERVPNDRGLQVVVDYAHTDNALEHVLMTAREFKPRRIVLVFGAGGDRDRDKRERMGRVAARLADWTVLTSDNPRSEEPGAIIAAIEAGFVREAVKTYEIEPDRRKAIVRALATANKGDIVIIAGKGHEDYQIFKDRTVHFSDREVAAETLRAKEAV